MTARIQSTSCRTLTREQTTITDFDELQASAKVWNTTELLEQIISYLPVFDMVVISGVNKMSYNCFNSSKFAQSKLFLQPSHRAQSFWLYCEFRDSTNFRFELEGKIVAQSFELSEEEYEKIHIARTAKIAKWVSAVALCPLLQLVDYQETSALGRIKRKGLYDERVILIGRPTENTKYANMILTDPPVHQVSAELTYKHTLHPLLMVRARRYVVDANSPLTFNTVVQSARQQVGDVFVHDPPTATNNYKVSHFFKPNSSIDAEVLLKVQEYGGKFVLDPKNSELVFEDRRVTPTFVVQRRIIVPSAKERLDMEAKRASEVVLDLYNWQMVR